MKKIVAVLLTALMSLSLLAGCGSSENKALVVGTNAEFPPFEYVGDDGQPDGFDIALIKEIGKRMGMEVQIENMDFNALVAAVGNKIDIAIAGMTVDEERKQSVDFSDNYYEALQYVIVMKDSEIAAAADLETTVANCFSRS